MGGGNKHTQPVIWAMKQIKLHKLNIYNVKYDVLIGRKLDESSSSGIAPQKSELKRQEYMQQAK